MPSFSIFLLFPDTESITWAAGGGEESVGGDRQSLPDLGREPLGVIRGGVLDNTPDWRYQDDWFEYPKIKTVLTLHHPLSYLPTFLPTCLPVFHCPYLPPSSPSTSHTGHPIDIELISNDHLPHTFPPTDKPSPQLQ